MKTFKEFKNNSQKEEVAINEAFFKVTIEDMARPIFVEAKSVAEVKNAMRKRLKGPVFMGMTIKRVTEAEMKMIYRSMAKGDVPTDKDKTPEKKAEPTKEGFLDVFSKKGREKRAKVSKRLAGVRKTRDQDEKDWEAWRRASSKASGRSGTQADVDRQKELEKKPYVRDRLKKYREKERERTKSR